MEGMLEELLTEVAARGGSDLHLTVGVPPLVRVDGELLRLEDRPVLTPEATAQLAYSRLSSDQRARFEGGEEIDLAFGVPGVARFRCNVFWQRGTVAAAPDGIPADLLGLDGASQTSPEAAMAMADGIRRLLGADIGIATAWAPAPDAPGGQRKGTVYLGLALDDQTMTEEVRLPGDRQRIRQYAVISLLNYLRKTLARRTVKAA